MCNTSNADDADATQPSSWVASAVCTGLNALHVLYRPTRKTNGFWSDVNSSVTAGTTIPHADRLTISRAVHELWQVLRPYIQKLCVWVRCGWVGNCCFRQNDRTHN